MTLFNSKIGLHIVLAFEVQIGDKPQIQIWNSKLFLPNKLELVHQLLAAENKEMFTVKQNHHHHHQKPKQRSPVILALPVLRWLCKSWPFSAPSFRSRPFWVLKVILGKVPKSGTELQTFPIWWIALSSGSHAGIFFQQWSSSSEILFNAFSSSQGSKI